MAYRKRKNDLEQAIDDCKQLSLYVKSEAYESIMSDYKYFYGINECNINSFINELIIDLMGYIARSQSVIVVNEAEFNVSDKNVYRSGEIVRFRLSADLRHVLFENETKCKSITNDEDKKDSIANLFIFKYGSINCDNPGYASYLKKYFDLLLNKYGSLPTHKREEIFFGERFSIISESISKHRKIKIESNDNVCVIRPYSLVADASVRYLYLTGYVNKDIRSFRLSRLSILDHDYDDNSGELRSKETEQIKKRIKESGVAYLSEVPEKNIEVLMTEYGFYLYSEVILHQRPDLIDNSIQLDPIEALNQEETDRYKNLTGHKYKKRVRCRCTKRQARYYFSRFGCEALIVKPDELAEECREFAVNAAKAYSGIIEK